MGYYINPTDGRNKEDWLKEEASEILARMKSFSQCPDDCLPVCLVDNVEFTAAGIAYCEEEFKAFNYDCGRPKLWFIVKKEKLKQFME